MNIERIKEIVGCRKGHAERILNGESDNYDGADGARDIFELCEICEELIKEIESK